MKVQIISAKPVVFACMMHGDTIVVEHKYRSLKLLKREAALRHTVDRNCEVTLSIIVLFNGITNHIIGDQATLEWLEELEEKSCEA